MSSTHACGSIDAAHTKGRTVETTDFNNSYMTWSAEHNFADTRKPGHMPWGNAARILIDARCTLIDSDGKLADELYLVAPCRTEWMYRETEMIQNPSGEYRAIFSEPHRLQLGVGKHIEEVNARGPAGSTDVFKWIKFDVTSKPSTRLDTDQDVVDATTRNVPIVAKTSFEVNGIKAVLEYPIRTMNYHDERTRFQVDTGPLIFPDLEADAKQLHRPLLSGPHGLQQLHLCRVRLQTADATGDRRQNRRLDLPLLLLQVARRHQRALRAGVTFDQGKTLRIRHSINGVRQR